ncbi:MAG: hypothetical protein R3281_13480 [Balneolaceae bacterium]|nr:hypothetical protein [Balneolaceae bacterium]
MLRVIFILIFFVIAILLSQMVTAQPPGLPANPEQTPVDGGLGILAAAGGAYAIKKLRERQKN